MGDVLFEEVNPNGNLQAVVESDDDVCYFYLFAAEGIDFGTRSVWLRNHTPAPDTLDVDGMKSGSPPKNPKAYCRHPDGLPRLEAESLRFVWLPEGDGVALYDGPALQAILPPWSGANGFSGYANEAIDDGPLAWEIGTDNVLIHRFQDAEAYWKLWDNNPWPSIQESLITCIEKQLGQHSNYYAIDGGNWPPKALLRIPNSSSTALITIGMSVRPQPQVEMSSEQPELLRRIELGTFIPPNWPDDAVKRFGSYISGQSQLPWAKYTWLGNGHTIPCDSWMNPDFPYALLLSTHPMSSTISLTPQFGDPVNILWFIPITEKERQTAIEQGSAELVKSLPHDRWYHA